MTAAQARKDTSDRIAGALAAERRKAEPRDARHCQLCGMPARFGLCWAHSWAADSLEVNQ